MTETSVYAPEETRRLMSSFPIFTKDGFLRYKRHQLNYLDVLSTAPFAIMGLVAAITRSCLFYKPFTINGWVSAGVVFVLANITGFGFFLVCFVITRYGTTDTAVYRVSALVLKKWYPFVQEFSTITAAASTSLVLYGRVLEGQCKDPDAYWETQGCNPVANLHHIPADAIILTFLMPILVQVMFKTVRIEVSIVSWALSTIMVIVCTAHVGGLQRDALWVPVFTVFFLLGTAEMERYMRVSYVFHNHAMVMQAKVLINNMKRDVSQALGPHLNAIYEGLDTLLHTQSVVVLLEEQELQNMSKIALACNNALRIIDQIAKADDLNDVEISRLEGSVLTGQVGLITRQAAVAEREPVDTPAVVGQVTDVGVASPPERIRFSSSLPLPRPSADTAIATTTAGSAPPQRALPPQPPEPASGRDSSNSASFSELHQLLQPQSPLEGQESMAAAAPVWDRNLQQSSSSAEGQNEYNTDDPELIQTQTTAEAARRLPLDVFAFINYDPARRDPRDPRYRPAAAGDAAAEGTPDDDPEVRDIFTAPAKI